MMSQYLNYLLKSEYLILSVGFQTQEAVVVVMTVLLHPIMDFVGLATGVLAFL